MRLKNLLRKSFHSAIKILPYEIQRRLKLAGTCLLGKEWEYFYLNFFAEEFANLSEEEVRNHFKDLSPRSVEVLLDYLKYCRLSHQFYVCVDKNMYDSIIVPLYHLYPALKEKISFERGVCKSLKKRCCFDTSMSESFCYHHGLKFVPQEVLEYIKGSSFLDLGAFIGDSAYIFSQYGPGKIIAFEPSVKNRRRMAENMRREKIDNVEIVCKGVSDQNGWLCMEEKGSRTSESTAGEQCEIVTVDSYCAQTAPGRIGLIKADLEGMGLKMVRGAMETIRKDHPVLLLAIYHNRDEFMGIYETLKEALPGYSFRVEALSGLSEVTLIGWPPECFTATPANC